MKRLSLLFLIFSLFFYPCFSYSQPGKSEEYLKYESPNIDSTMPNMFSASIRIITVLLTLLALFFSFIFFLKKFQQRKNIQEKGPISILCRLPVGSKESILMVNVMGEILVLGVTSAQISLLFKVENAEGLPGSETKGYQFQSYLKSEQKNIKVTTVLESLRALRDKLRKA